MPNKSLTPAGLCKLAHVDPGKVEFLKVAIACWRKIEPELQTLHCDRPHAWGEHQL